MRQRLLNRLAGWSLLLCVVLLFGVRPYYVCAYPSGGYYALGILCWETRPSRSPPWIVEVAGLHVDLYLGTILFLTAGPVVWLLAASTRAFGHLRGYHRERRGLCPACAYDLRATPGRCPECGFTLLATTSE